MFKIMNVVYVRSMAMLTQVSDVRKLWGALISLTHAESLRYDENYRFAFIAIDMKKLVHGTEGILHFRHTKIVLIEGECCWCDELGDSLNTQIS